MDHACTVTTFRGANTRFDAPAKLLLPKHGDIVDRMHTDTETLTFGAQLLPQPTGAEAGAAVLGPRERVSVNEGKMPRSKRTGRRVDSPSQHSSLMTV